MQLFKQMSMAFVLVGLTQSTFAGSLHYAVTAGNYDEVVRLVESGEKIDELEPGIDDRFTPLGLTALSLPPIRIAEYLLEKKAKTNKPSYLDMLGWFTPLGIAISLPPTYSPGGWGSRVRRLWGRWKVAERKMRWHPYIKLLLKYVDPNEPCHEDGGFIGYPLYMAVEQGMPKVVDLLLNAGAREEAGYDAPHLLVSIGIGGKNHVAVTKRLLRGKEINQPISWNRKSYTPLSWAYHFQKQGAKNEDQIALLKSLGGITGAFKLQASKDRRPSRHLANGRVRRRYARG